MSFQIFRMENDFLAQSERSNLDAAIERAIELIPILDVDVVYIFEVVDNSAAKKIDWMEPSWKKIPAGVVTLEGITNQILLDAHS